MDVAHAATDSHAPDAAGVLRGLAALGYDGLAQAICDAQQHTGLTPHELAMRLGLPPEALVLWVQGSFIPRTDHLLRLGKVLADHQPHQPGPPSIARPPASQRRPAPSRAVRPDNHH